MKIAFISDIHGNYEALSAVLSKIDQLGIQGIFCAGDVCLLYTSPSPRDRQKSRMPSSA